MRKKINVGLIGAGRLGTMYAEFLTTRVAGANLIAVGNSGMSGVTRFVLGSVPDKVAVTRPAAC